MKFLKKIFYKNKIKKLIIQSLDESILTDPYGYLYFTVSIPISKIMSKNITSDIIDLFKQDMFCLKYKNRVFLSVFWRNCILVHVEK